MLEGFPMYLEYTATRNQGICRGIPMICRVGVNGPFDSAHHRARIEQRAAASDTVLTNFRLVSNNR